MRNGLILVNRDENKTNVTYFDREQIEFAKQNALVDKRIKERIAEDLSAFDGCDFVEHRKGGKGYKSAKRKISLLIRVCEIFGTMTVLSLGWVKTELALAVILFCLISICVHAGMMVEESEYGE